MAPTRWDPVRDLLTLQSRINQALSEGAGRGGADDTYGAWTPPVDIFEKGDDLVIRAELPGVNKDDIDVRVEENTLVLRGERRPEIDVEESKTYRMERVFGSFARRFGLPTTVDPSRISARYLDGVLEITLPKAEDAKPRKIDIQVV